MATPSAVRYNTLAIVFHWILAVMILFQLVLGLRMAGMPHGTDAELATLFKAFNLHKSVGVLILVLAALRLLWRLVKRPPVLPDTMPLWQKGIAHATHGLLYLAFFAVPLSGWLMSSAHDRSVSFFGLFTLPDLIAPDKALAEQLEEVHEFLAISLAGLVLLHIGAALQHFLINRDDILARMLPFARWPAR